MTAPRILVIDDSATVRKLIEIAFRGSDCVVEFAGTGAEGIARAATAPPDVILLDFMLPDMKGIEVVKRLAHGDAARVGVVVMSGKPDVAALFRDHDNVVAFLAKPFTASEVHAQVGTALRQRSRRTSVAPRPQLAPGTPPAGVAVVPPPARVAMVPPPAGVAVVPPPAGVAVVPPPASAGQGGAQLELAGSLAGVTAFDLLRLIAASGATGYLHLEHGTDVFVRAGTVVMCTTTRSTDEFDRLVMEVDGEAGLARAQATQRQSGVPAVVSLAEAGVAPKVDLAAALKSQSHRLLADAVVRRDGRFRWYETALPGYVASFGRPVSLAAAALEEARTRPASAVDLAQVYRRRSGFSSTVAGLPLTPVEKAMLAAIDGTSTLGEIGERLRYPARLVAATVAHLAAVDLIARDDGAGRSGSAVAPLVVHNLDAEFVAQLRSLATRRSLAAEVIDVSLLGELDVVLPHARPRLVMIGADARALPTELRALASLTSATIAAVLEVPDPRGAAPTLALGYDAVLCKPVHVAELERLLAL